MHASTARRLAGRHFPTQESNVRVGHPSRRKELGPLFHVENDGLRMRDYEFARYSEENA